jgi:hypothetical protein
MHFTYDEIRPTELMQGDVLERTSAIDALLEEVHPHFFQHLKNLFFMVLTQSCDLVPRAAGGKCKAQYIAIAPVRSLDVVVARYISDASAADVRSSLPVISDKVKTKASEFLARVMNNNEPGYFFLEGKDTPLGSDCAAFLNLSIAIKSEIHFATCLEAKILQLRPDFQAKLGWLLGQLFSRVGTQDWDQKVLTKKVSAFLKDAAIWVPDAKIAYLEEAFARSRDANPDAEMTAMDVASALKQAPTRKHMIIDRATKVIAEALGPEREEDVMLLRRRLESDEGLTMLLK